MNYLEIDKRVRNSIVKQLTHSSTMMTTICCLFLLLAPKAQAAIPEVAMQTYTQMAFAGMACGTVLLLLYLKREPLFVAIRNYQNEMTTRKKTVLVADDDMERRYLTGFRLERAGYKAIYAEDGIEALIKAKKHLPDFIIMDIYMPKMNGNETSIRIQKEKMMYHPMIYGFTADNPEDWKNTGGFEAFEDVYCKKDGIGPVIRELDLH